MKEFLTVNDVQKILKFGRKKTYRLVNQPDFPKIRFGHDIRIPADEFEKWLKHTYYTTYDF